MIVRDLYFLIRGVRIMETRCLSFYMSFLDHLLFDHFCEWIWIKTPLQIYDVITQGILSNPHAIMPKTCLLCSLSFILI